MIPYQDSDGRARLYPQSLYKQLSLPNNHPQMGPDDITAMFNSNMNYWFEGDPTPMSERQVDLLTNFNCGQPVTSLADQLNQFQINAEGTEQDFMNSFSKSPQFSIAKDMYNRAENHGTMGFVLSSNIQPNTQLTTDQIQNDIILLETSLNPFQPSSSIGHVDFQTYKNTSDFLMMFTYPPGRTLNDMMSLSGSTKTTGPMGPKLRLLLGILGYDVKKDYSPPAINTSSDSSIISFNLVLSFVCILLTIINYY
ncbi:unnamed protein product [Rhizophagus irregularis]|nr:unnamed protein product [Rhizophagus irregularis]CAB5378632.1 unnamed protein product [Rhizophagus irregularis]